jgi:hypothetical protein
LDNTKSENEIKNLKSKEEIEDKHLQTEIGTGVSSIKTITAVDKA